jgi:hypothetical protein
VATCPYSVGIQANRGRTGRPLSLRPGAYRGFSKPGGGDPAEVGLPVRGMACLPAEVGLGAPPVGAANVAVGTGVNCCPPDDGLMPPDDGLAPPENGLGLPVAALVPRGPPPGDIWYGAGRMAL